MSDPFFGVYNMCNNEQCMKQLLADIRDGQPLASLVLELLQAHSKHEYGWIARVLAMTSAPLLSEVLALTNRIIDIGETLDRASQYAFGCEMLQAAQDLATQRSQAYLALPPPAQQSAHGAPVPSATAAQLEETSRHESRPGVLRVICTMAGPCPCRWACGQGLVQGQLYFQCVLCCSHYKLPDASQMSGRYCCKECREWRRMQPAKMPKQSAASIDATEEPQAGQSPDSLAAPAAKFPPAQSLDSLAAPAA